MSTARPILITAGATRNPIDAMRYISAHSSGATGVHLATELAKTAPIHLCGSPEALLRLENKSQKLVVRHSISSNAFSSTHNLMHQMAEWIQKNPGGIVLHAAAVGDYAAPPDAGKIESGQEHILLKLHPTPKILDRLRNWSRQLFVVSFKAAAPHTTRAQLETIALSQLTRTHSNVVFANVIGNIEHGICIHDGKRARWYEDRPDALTHLLDLVRAACAESDH